MNRENGLESTDRLHLTEPVNPVIIVGARVNGFLKRDLQNGNGGVHPSAVRELEITGFDEKGQIVLVSNDRGKEEVRIGIEEFVYGGGLDDPDAEVYRLVQDFA